MNRHRILVVYDGSEASFWALQQAAATADRSGAEIGIVTVMPPIVDAPADAIRYLRDLGHEATLHTPFGDPADAIARTADEGAYDTVYLGTTEGTIGRKLGPSVSREVVKRAPVSVVLAR